jgi:hypothetical protein
MMAPRHLPLGLLALTILAAASPAQAGPMLEYGGFRWNSDNAGVIVPPSSSGFAKSADEPFNTPKSGFLADNPLFNSSLNGTTTGRQLGGDGPDARAATLGTPDARGTFTYSFANGIGNGVGDDLVLFEQGYADQPEGMMVRLKAADGTFSAWRYEFFDTQTAYPAGYLGVAYGTGFDLDDFGFGSGAHIVELEVANLLATDRVSGADGQGFVRFLGDLLYPESSVALDPTRKATFAEGQYDPDIIYAAALATPVPEPASILVFAAAGGFIALSRRRKAAATRA